MLHWKPEEMREVCAERKGDGEGWKFETSRQLGSRPAYLPEQMFKILVPVYLLLTLWVFPELRH